MAGNYPDVPGQRMAYDRDGTVVAHINGAGSITELTTAQKQALNDESGDVASASGTSWGLADDNDPDNYVAFLFPELRDILAYFICHSSGGVAAATLEKSTDTTNGQDGTWSTVSNPYTVAAQVVPNYRSAISSISALGVKALRFKMDPSSGSGTDPIYAIHLYGKPAAGETTYLKLWHGTNDAEVAGAHFDYGDVARGSSADKTFRVKNTHGSLTANDVTLTLEALTDTNPSVPAQYLLSTDGVNFSASVNLGNLAPGALSGVITIRRNTASGATLGLWTARLLAIAGSWT